MACPPLESQHSRGESAGSEGAMQGATLPFREVQPTQSETHSSLFHLELLHLVHLQVFRDPSTIWNCLVWFAADLLPVPSRAPAK